MLILRAKGFRDRRRYLFLSFIIIFTSPLLYSQSPWVRPDFTQVSEDVSVLVNVLANDYHFTEIIDTHTLTVVLDPNHGQAGVESTHAILYKPNSNFFGIDSFTYKLCSTVGQCEEAIVKILVHAINDAPIAQNDLDTVDEDSSILLDVMENDSDLADNILMENTPVVIIEMPKQGLLTVEPDGLKYLPHPNYYGNDYFRYSICDESLCDTAMVRIHVKSINDPPKVQDDFETTIRGLLLVMDPLANDHDSLDLLILDRSSLSLDGGLQPKHGFSYLDQDVGLIVYVPNDDFVGMDSFQYQVCDLGPETILCDWGTIIVEVTNSTAAEDDHLLVGGNPQPSDLMMARREIKTDLLEKPRRENISEYLKVHSLTPGRYQYSITNGSLRLSLHQGS